MDDSATTALATLLGAATGGLTSVLATWLMHRTQARAQWLEQDALRRQNLYRDFIEMAARCYVHALQHQKKGIFTASSISMPRSTGWASLSSGKIVEIAERFARKIVDTYSEPNKRFIELREMIDRNSVNLTREFSISCREELETLRTV